MFGQDPRKSWSCRPISSLLVSFFLHVSGWNSGILTWRAVTLEVWSVTCLLSWVKISSETAFKSNSANIQLYVTWETFGLLLSYSIFLILCVYFTKNASLMGWKLFYKSGLPHVICEVLLQNLDLDSRVPGTLPFALSPLLPGSWWRGWLRPECAWLLICNVWGFSGGSGGR